MVAILIVLGVIFSPFIIAIVLYALAFIVCCIQSGIYMVEFREYPRLERIRAEEAIVYNNEKYFFVNTLSYYENGEWIEPEYYIELNYCEEKMVASLYTPYLGIFPGFSSVCVSDFDPEANILSMSGYGYYVKEGFVFPTDPDNMAVDRAFIGVNEDSVSGYDDRIYLPDLGDGFTYASMLEEEKETLKVSSEERYLARCSFELEGYKFLKSCNFYLLDFGGTMYATRYEEVELIASTGEYSYVMDCYKIKEEYQETFKSAFDRVADPSGVM